MGKATSGQVSIQFMENNCGGSENEVCNQTDTNTAIHDIVQLMKAMCLFVAI